MPGNELELVTSFACYLPWIEDHWLFDFRNAVIRIIIIDFLSFKIKFSLQELQLAEAKEGPSPKPNSPTALPPGVETPSKFLDPNKHYMPKWNLTAAFAMLESPEVMTPKGKHIRRPSTVSFNESLFFIRKNCRMNAFSNN